jgi:hypothetical protein
MRRPRATFRTRLAAIAVSVLLLGSCSGGSANADDAKQIDCRGGDALLLAFQAVPTATYVPCLAAIPVGWTVGGSQIRSGLVRFWLDSDRAGFHAVDVTLTKTCDTTGAIKTDAPVPEPGITRYEAPLSLPPRFALDRFDVFTGGCVTYRYAFSGDASSLLVFDLDPALRFLSRSFAVRKVKEQIGLTLCGAEAPACPG